jgi:Spy/CpxP family protein refolding chaperone
MKTQVAVSTMMVMLVGSWLCQTNKAHGQQRAQRAKDAFAERLQDMNLTDEQETKTVTIRKEFSPKVEKDAKELADLAQAEVDKVKAVLTAAQKEMLKNLKDERADRRAESLAERLAHLEELDLTPAEMTKIAAIRKEYRPKIEKALEGLKGALTDDQRKARAEALESGKKHSEVIASLKLTAEQKEKLVAVGKEVRPLIREKLEKVRDVLSAEQQEKLAELKSERKEHVRDHMASAIENFRDLNLTDEQKSQIAAIRQEYRPKIHEAGNKLRADVRQELTAIVDVIKS